MQSLLSPWLPAKYALARHTSHAAKHPYHGHDCEIACHWSQIFYMLPQLTRICRPQNAGLQISYVAETFLRCVVGCCEYAECMLTKYSHSKPCIWYRLELVRKMCLCTSTWQIWLATASWYVLLCFSVHVQVVGSLPSVSFAFRRTGLCAVGSQLVA